MGVQDTSRLAYAKVIPELRPRQKIALQALRDHGPMTNLELAYHLHWPINSTTPRTKELKTLGYVRKAGRRPCRHSGNMANVLEVVPEQREQLSFF